MELQQKDVFEGGAAEVDRDWLFLYDGMRKTKLVSFPCDPLDVLALTLNLQKKINIIQFDAAY